MSALPAEHLPAEQAAPPRRRRRRGQPGAAAPTVTFTSAGVPVPLVAALAEEGITAPFPIQAATLPDALAGLDILGRGQTGSGKTLGFSIPLAARLADGFTSAAGPAAWYSCRPANSPARSRPSSCRWPARWT